MIGHITDPSVPHRLNPRELPEPSPGSHDAVLDVRAYAINRGAKEYAPWVPRQAHRRAAAHASTPSRSFSTS